MWIQLCYFRCVLGSIENGFVFLCNPKAGSTSVETALRRYAQFQVGLGSPFWKHMSWQTYKAVFGEFFESQGAVGYAIIRHPLDILSSWWRYRQRPEILERSHARHNRRTSDIAFSDWLQLWASRSDAPSTLFPTQKETLQTPTGDPAPLRYFHLEDICLFESEISEKVGNRVTFDMLNVSPAIDHDVDEDFLLTLPRFREELAFFETLSDRAVK